MSHEPLRVGSTDTLKITVKDDQAGVLNPVDLSGATLVLKCRINRGAVKTFSPVVPDPDQVGKKGKASYKLLAADIDKAGEVELDLWVTLGADTHKAAILHLDAE